MSDTVQVKIVLPAGGPFREGAGSRVFINGIEFENLEVIDYGTKINSKDIIRSTITLTFAGDILVERDG